MDLPLTIFLTWLALAICDDGVRLMSGAGDMHRGACRFRAGLEGCEELLETGNSSILLRRDFGNERVQIDFLEGFDAGRPVRGCEVVQGCAQELIP